MPTLLAIILLAATSLALLMLAITYLPAIIIKRGHLKQLRMAARGKLVLTYDDGPGRELTSALIELLERHGAKATFFLVGFRAASAPQVCDALQAAGHEMGCHTHMHKRPWQVLPWSAAKDVHDGYSSMQRWLGRAAPFRPPFGKLTTWSWIAARMRGAPTCFWTVDGCDTKPNLPDPETIAKSIIDQNGAVVLLHNHDRGSDRRDYVLAITDHLLRLAKERGLEVCTMSELMNGSTTPAGAAQSIPRAPALAAAPSR